MKLIHNFTDYFTKIHFNFSLPPASTSETSVDIQLRTRQYILEDSEINSEDMYRLKRYNVFDLPTRFNN
jgi:hypothetical protein